jgi:GH25 family lysozyme M1 (1,4-beta-N-acetylmuramidase)
VSLYLIDVSSHQGEIDGAQIKAADYDGVIVKLTEGTDYHNPYLDHQIQQARDNDLRVGFYHYARQDITRDPLAESAWFLLWALPRIQPGDLLAGDFEQADDRGDLSAWALGWLSYVQEKTSVKPFLYTYPWYAIAHLADPALKDFPLWYASYPKGVTSPADLGDRPMPQAPVPWDKIVIWQFTGGSPVAGTTFPTDLNRFDGTADDLAAYGKWTSV